MYPDVHGCSNDSSLYFIDEHSIKCIDLKTSNHTYVSIQTVKTGLVQAGAIDIDHRNRMIYWSDNSLWTINRMNLKTSETEVIFYCYVRIEEVKTEELNGFRSFFLGLCTT